MRRIFACLLAMLLLLGGAQAEAFTPITVEERDYLNNIDVCIETIGKIELDTDEAFSFNACVGGRTEDKGYRMATNGRGVEVIGGGVAQVATTIYLAVKNRSDLELLDVFTYGADFCEDYVADASEAVFTDYAQSMDFSFANRGEPLVMSIWREGSRIYCSIQEAEQ